MPSLYLSYSRPSSGAFYLARAVLRGAAQSFQPLSPVLYLTYAEHMSQEKPVSKVTGSHLKQYDPVQRATAEQELSDGMRAPGIRHNEWLRKMAGLVGGVIAAILLYFLLPADLEIWPKLTAATAVLMAIWWMTEAIPIPVTALLPLIIFPLAVPA